MLRTFASDLQKKALNYMIKINRFMKYILIILLSILCLNTDIFSQEEISFTMEEAQEYALEHNRQLKNASIDIQKTEASRWQAIASILPQINATVDYANMMGYKMEMPGFNISMPPYGTLSLTTSVSVSASQVIGIQMEKISSKMADLTYEQSELQLIQQVKSLYYSTLVMEETSDLTKRSLDNLNELLQHTLQMVKAGVTEETEANQIAVQVASMEANCNSIDRSLEMLYNSLRLQLGFDADKEIKLTQSIEELLNIDKTLSLLSYDFIMDKNLDYRLLMENIVLAQKQVDIKKWAYAPTINGYHQYSAKKYFSDEATMNMTPPNMVGLTLSIPIFSSGSRYKAVQEAKLDYQQQMNTLADTKESLLIQHRQLCFNLSSAYESFEVQKKNTEVARDVFSNITRKYEKGIASSLDVTDSGTNLLNAQNNYVQSLMDLVEAQLQLEELLNNDNK